ncbi:hypothetical protein SSS_03363, partial [Sarcoptes scabiei]
IFLSYFKLVFFYLFIFFFCFTQIVFKIEMTDLIDSYYNCPKLWPLPTDLFNEVCMNGSFEKQSNSFATLTPTPNQNLFDFDSDGSNSGFTTSSITPVTSNRTSPIFFPETDYVNDFSPKANSNFDCKKVGYQVCEKSPKQISDPY